MKKFFIFCVFLFSGNIVLSAQLQLPPLKPIEAVQEKMSQNPVSSDSETKFVQKQPLNSNDEDVEKFTPLIPDKTVNYPKINQIEQVLYGKKYSNQGISCRLSRIEQSMFNKNFTQNSLSDRVDNIVSNFYGDNKSFTTPVMPSVLPKGALSKIERKIFNQDFDGEDESARLSRLEEKVLGAVQTGGIKPRYEKLSSAMKHSNSFDKTFQGQRHGLAGILDKLEQGITTGGTMTGFTPPLDGVDDFGYGYQNYTPYSNYSNYDPGYGLYRGVRTNTGYLDQFKSYGSGTGVHILD